MADTVDAAEGRIRRRGEIQPGDEAKSWGVRQRPTEIDTKSPALR